MRTILSGLGAGLVLVFAAACGGSAATQAPVGGGAAAASCSPTLGTGQQVAIANFAFNPKTITIPAGTSISWTNGDTTTHTVTFDKGPDCGNVATGTSTTITFATAGTYTYHCKIHSSMTASVTVS